MRHPLAALAIVSAAACAGTKPAEDVERATPEKEPPMIPSQAKATPAPQAPAPDPRAEIDRATTALVSALVAKHGESERTRIERGVRQVAALWRAEDGDLLAFGQAHYLASDEARTASFNRLQAIFEQIDGHLNEIVRDLKRPTDIEMGPILGVDPLLSAFDPGAHLTEDLFNSKIAFVALLNFPLANLEEMTAGAAKWSRREWAEARLVQRFAQRVPGTVAQEIAQAAAEADLYIAGYNIRMHHLLDPSGVRPFPKGMRLISHWNLRDEIKARYADKEGLPKQRIIAKVMERIVNQTIPAAVIDDPRVDWDPEKNFVTPAPADTVEDGAPARPVKAASDREEDVRYARILAHFRAARKADPYCPTAPTRIFRAYDIERELTEERVRGLFESVLTSPAAPRVGALIEKRLGRKLEPHDLWYDGFKARSQAGIDLDGITKKKYPNAQTFAADIPRILTALGFPKERSRYVSERIRVEPSRGAGHAWQASRRGDFAHLRTRIEVDGMSYKGYNIAVHELGHNVEQVLSLYAVDHTLLAGVPNNAFTEAMAFVFQGKDLDLLGLSKGKKPADEHIAVLDDFWSTWEISGVALVDNAVWHWMYDHPNATPAELREATIAIAKDHWNRFYAPILGGKDTVLLGIYSHMVSYPLYLAHYPLGHLIAFQVEDHIRRSGKLGPEFERMVVQGRLIPDQWMKGATGQPVGAEPLLRATEAALAAVN